MNGKTKMGWRVIVAGLGLAAAVAVGGTLALGQGAATAPAAVSAADHAAAVESFKKARDLFQANKFAEANAENDKALALDPQFPEALVLRGIIRGKMAEGPTTGTGSESSTAPGAMRLLKPTDIALLRINEWSSDDAQVHGKVASKTLEEFWNDVLKKKEGTDVSVEAHNKFVNPANFAAQVQAIRDSGNTKYMEQVEFNSDPAALLTFKKTVQPYVLQNCATAACHAGDKAGNFKLFRPAPGSANEAMTYTNFYILAMYTGKDGKMIDHDKPEQSLLLQYGMVNAAATIPHPGKVNVRHFADKSAPEFKTISDWIEKSLRFPRPNYGIVYELPGSAAATAPAMAPASAPATQSGPQLRPAGK